MKYRIVKIFVFLTAFMIGGMLSFDTRFSVWPSIPDAPFKDEVLVRCYLMAENEEGGDSCVCVEIDE